MNPSMKDRQKGGGKGQGVRAAVLQEKETLKKNGQRTSQQEMSDKPSNNTGPARLEMDEYEGDDMQVNDEGMRGDEEREVMERTETKKRRNKASKAVENSTKRKMHEKGNNPSLERYVTCDVAFAGFVSHRHGSHLNFHLLNKLESVLMVYQYPVFMLFNTITNSYNNLEHLMVYALLSLNPSILMLSKNLGESQIDMRL